MLNFIIVCVALLAVIILTHVIMDLAEVAWNRNRKVSRKSNKVAPRSSNK